ncbi:MAG TPA: hypothetical protein VI564_09555 [Candidatus Nanoarchaeia archaeon]|nr:hypothetical protein [Candidatus Nanoarchaeia archaeon]
MKSLIFDTGPIISLTTNNLLWILEPLKEKFAGKFYITEAVKRELIDGPIYIKRFKFEAIQVQRLIDVGVLEVISANYAKEDTLRLLKLSNSIFRAFNHDMTIVHHAEMSVIAAALEMEADAVVIDEKTTRFLIEDPKTVIDILKKSLHTSIAVNESNLKEFNKSVTGTNIIRSVELAALAYEMGFLNDLITKIQNPEKNLLESILWGVKLNGCAVSEDEINQIIDTELK